MSLHQTSFPSSQARTRVLSQSKWSPRSSSAARGGGEDGGGVGDDEDGGGEEEGGVGGGGDDGDGAEGGGLEVVRVLDWRCWRWWIGGEGGGGGGAVGEGGEEKESSSLQPLPSSWEKEGREKSTFLSTTLTNLRFRMVAAEGVADETLEQCQI